jgi:hypothetical protein
MFPLGWGALVAYETATDAIEQPQDSAALAFPATAVQPALLFSLASQLM